MCVWCASYIGYMAGVFCLLWFLVTNAHCSHSVNYSSSLIIGPMTCRHVTWRCRHRSHQAAVLITCHMQWHCLLYLLICILAVLLSVISIVIQPQWISNLYIVRIYHSLGIFTAILFKSIHHSWRYERKCEWVFFSEHSVHVVVWQRHWNNEIRCLCKACVHLVVYQLCLVSDTKFVDWNKFFVLCTAVHWPTQACS